MSQTKSLPKTVANVELDGGNSLGVTGPRQFLRRFRQAFGASRSQYITRLRLDAPLERVALGCGFKSFRRTFERHFHIPPDEYQRRFRS